MANPWGDSWSLDAWAASAWASGGLGPNQHIQRDCPCCCECRWCAGVGYWSEYTVVVSGATIETQFNRAYNLVVRSSTSGRCGWAVDGDDGGFSSSLVQQVFLGDDVWRFAVFDSGSGIGATWGDTAFTDCLNGFVLPLAGSSSPLGGTPIATVTPAGTWTSCGQDSSGTPIGDGIAPLGFVAAAAAARTPLRTVRCLYLGRRIETVGCCDGGRRHECDHCRPAVPGEYCQTCPEYVPDGDAGW
jgi:hypothetical protein